MKQIYARVVLRLILPALNLSIARPSSDQVVRYRRVDLAPEVLAYSDGDVLADLMNSQFFEGARCVLGARQSARKAGEVKALMTHPEQAEFVWLDIEERVVTGMVEIDALPAPLRDNPDYMREITRARASLESARRLLREAGHPGSAPVEGGANGSR